METNTLPSETNLFLPPGPVPIPAFVREAMAQPVIHHRGEKFVAIFEAILQGLRYLFQTENSTGMMIGSGTFGVETGMYSLFSPGQTIVVVNNGKFSGRWAEYAETIGLTCIEVVVPWGGVPHIEQIIESVGTHKPEGIVITHCETSTGALTDLEPLASSLRARWPDLCILVDAITTVGAMPFYLDAWGIDAAVIASQKALMNPAGIICWALSERAKQRLRPSRPGDFANWYNYDQAAENLSFPFTAPITGMYGIRAVLDQIQDRGLPAVWNEVHHASLTFKTEIGKIGGKVIGDSPSDSLTVLDWKNDQLQEVNAHLLAHGIELAGGQGPWKHKILRISHMGTSARPEIVEQVLACLNEYSRRN